VRSPARSAIALLALAGAATGVLWQLRGGEGPAGPATRSAVLVVVRLPSGPLVAAVASGGERSGSAIAIPTTSAVTVPGQGQSTVAEAAALPGAPAAAAMSNLLGVWIPHYAMMDASTLAARVDREGGLSLFEKHLDGRGVVSALGERGRSATWLEVMRALLWSADPWRPTDFTDVDHPATVDELLTSVGRPRVTPLPTSRVPGGVPQIDDARAQAILGAFGRTTSAPTPVVVLNGGGVPSVGQSAAAQLIPAGFRIVDSGNASSFGYRTTLVVASTEDDRAFAERAQAALGVGRVSVAGAPTGLASVTIVLGKDYRPA
jgi:LytR cell envelope-related transcriptional attenuator